MPRMCFVHKINHVNGISPSWVIDWMRSLFCLKKMSANCWWEQLNKSKCWLVIGEAVKTSVFIKVDQHVGVWKVTSKFCQNWIRSFDSDEFGSGLLFFAICGHRSRWKCKVQTAFNASCSCVAYNKYITSIYMFENIFKTFQNTRNALWEVSIGISLKPEKNPRCF